MSRKNYDVERLLARADAFWGRVSFVADGCWVWLGSVDWKGYGRFGDWRASRASVVISTGKAIPEGMHVCHRCDEPSCVRPDHLYVGTHAENMRDRDERGRTAAGDRHGCAKLSAEQAADIHSRYADGEHAVDLAVEYGVSTETVRAIGNGRAWRVSLWGAA